MTWRVEHRFTYGWDDAGWWVEQEGGSWEPERFASRQAAELAILAFLADVVDADMDGYVREDFRTKQE